MKNLINSVNWAEKLSMTEKANLVVCCGDFFDKSTINSEELSALTEVEWNKDVNHVMLVGNHEMWSNDLKISSANVFKFLGFFVADSPYTEKTEFGELCFIPYVDSTKSISDYVPAEHKGKRIIFSHNDISGIQMGKFVSKNGFNVTDIESCCDLFINGHLHNGERVSSKIINVGNLTGQNFGENAFIYKHGVFIIDTSTLECKFVENPFALNFYKMKYDSFPCVKDSIVNGVVTVYCKEDFVSLCKDELENCKNIVSFKIVPEREKQETVNNSIEKIRADDHLEQFRTYIASELGLSDVVKQELSEVCK
jgi:DNA repair exonuclease SbcCD nuclease subunit